MIFSRLLFEKYSHFNSSKPVDLHITLLGMYSVSNEILPLILADYFELYNVYDLKFRFLTLEMICTHWYKKLVSSDFEKLFSSYLLHWFHVWWAPKQTFLVLLFFFIYFHFCCCWGWYSIIISRENKRGTKRSLTTPSSSSSSEILRWE